MSHKALEQKLNHIQGLLWPPPNPVLVLVTIGFGTEPKVFRLYNWSSNTLENYVVRPYKSWRIVLCQNDVRYYRSKVNCWTLWRYLGCCENLSLKTKQSINRVDLDGMQYSFNVLDEENIYWDINRYSVCFYVTKRCVCFCLFFLMTCVCCLSGDLRAYQLRLNSACGYILPKSFFRFLFLKFKILSR